MVSDIKIAVMAFNAVVGVAFPVLVGFLMHKKYGVGLKGMFVGALVFLIAVLVLESAVNSLVLSAGWIQGKVSVALYGGIMAGLFEEGGRLIAMKYFVGKQGPLSYGIGHGGMEFLAILTLGMISNISLSVLINQGMTDSVTSALSGDAKEKIEEAFSMLESCSPLLFLTALWERISAFVLQIGLSVLVWEAVTKGRWWLLPTAVVLHASVDFCAVMMKDNIIVTEIVITAIALAIAAIAWKVYSKPMPGQSCL